MGIHVRRSPHRPCRPQQQTRKYMRVKHLRKFRSRGKNDETVATAPFAHVSPPANTAAGRPLRKTIWNAFQAKVKEKSEKKIILPEQPDRRSRTNEWARITAGIPVAVVRTEEKIMKTKSTLQKASNREDRGYQPTAREIRRACVSIRRRWTDREMRKRAGLIKEEPWTPPQTRIEFEEDDAGGTW